MTLLEKISHKQGEIKAYEDWLQKHYEAATEKKEVQQKLNLATIELQQLKDEQKFTPCSPNGHGGC